MKEPRFRPVAIRSPRGARTTYVDWADGHKAVYPHDVLRGLCPCAGCQGHSGEIKRLDVTDAQQELEDITTVGSYAVGLKWFDGHDSGIYTHEYLRSLCRCAACAAEPPGGV